MFILLVITSRVVFGTAVTAYLDGFIQGGLLKKGIFYPYIQVGKKTEQIFKSDQDYKSHRFEITSF
jgi:hypothetical protein